MSHYRPQPPWEFLLTASRNTLQSYELSRLSHAANVRKEIGALLDQWLEENANAMLARWLIDQRKSCVPEQGSPAPSAGVDYSPQSANATTASDNIFADSHAPHAAFRARV